MLLCRAGFAPFPPDISSVRYAIVRETFSAYMWTMIPRVNRPHLVNQSPINGHLDGFKIHAFEHAYMSLFLTPSLMILDELLAFNIYNLEKLQFSLGGDEFV